MTAGAISAMKIAGKMKMPVGNTILTGAFVACSSAARRRRCRDSEACVRNTWPSGVPSCSDWISEFVTDVSSGNVDPVGHPAQRLRTTVAHGKLAENELELLDKRAVLVLAELRERTVETESGLDADREDVERIGKLTAHHVSSRTRSNA